VGCAEGFTDGLTLGEALGLVGEGFMVGCCVGSKDGPFVGFLLGSSVGVKVGSNVGELLGFEVGL